MTTTVLRNKPIPSKFKTIEKERKYKSRLFSVMLHTKRDKSEINTKADRFIDILIQK